MKKKLTMLLLMIIVLVAGCSVSNEEMEDAVFFCDGRHNGYDKWDGANHVCNDGTMFSISIYRNSSEN